MTIVYCILDHTPSGGTERTLSLQANYFAAKGNDVHIVTTEVPMLATPAYHFDERITVHNLDIRYREVDGGRTPGKILSRLRKGKLHEQRLFALLGEVKPHVTVTFYGHEMTFLYRSPDPSIKVVQYHFSRHSRDIENRGMPLLRRLFDRRKEQRKQRCINRYAAFVVLTRRDAQLWQGIHNIHVIPNALPFRPAPVDTQRKKVVLAVGRLVVEKGYDHLLNIWSEVAPTHPEWRLHIYGAGPEEEHLKQQIAQRKLTNSAQIFAPTSQIVEVYQKSSIFALTSQYEGFGMVLAEAMACGVPCVSFDAPCGPAEIIRDGQDGFIVTMNDDAAFAARLAQLIDREELRLEMGRQAQLNIQRYAPEVVMQQWERLYGQLIHQ